MESLQAFMILALFLGIGEIVAVKTKAYIGSTFVMMALLLIAFWCGLDPEIVTKSQAVALGTICIGLLMVNLATSISLREFLKQWKTIIIGVGAVVFIALFCGGIGSMLIGKLMAYSGTPIVAGGINAYLILSGPLQEAGRDQELVFALLILSIQMLIGTPLCSIIMKKDAVNFKSTGRINEYIAAANQLKEEGQRKTLIPHLPASMQKSAVLLFKCSFVAFLGYFVSSLSGGKINGMILCMIFGIIFHAIGFLEDNILDKAGASGFLMTMLMFYVFSNTSQATPDMVIDLIVPMIIIFVLGIAGIVVNAFIMSKILKESFLMNIGIGLVALIGFPGIFYISKEVSEAVGENEEERKAVEEYTMPRLVVANFATMTIPSVVLASIMLPMIQAAL